MIDLVLMHPPSVARTLAVATALACASTTAQSQVLPMSCGVSAGETRWLTESYSQTHTYGLGSEEEWIGSYGGLTAAGDSLFLYDQYRPRIVHLSGDLEERHAFGRKGEEFRWSTPLPLLSSPLTGVRFVTPAGEEEMIFGVDSLEVSRRRFQLWRVQRPNPSRCNRSGCTPWGRMVRCGCQRVRSSVCTRWTSTATRCGPSS